MARRITARSEEKRIRDQFLRDLEREGERIVKQLSQQLTRDLEDQAGKFLTGASDSARSGGGAIGFDAGASLTRLFGSALTYVFSRPRVSRTTRETDRSKEADQRFKLGRRQALAEAGIELNRGDKNL